MNKKKLLITGGAGFIGSHVVRRFLSAYPSYRIVNADALTYAGNLENLTDVENHPNYYFEKIDITDKKAVEKLFDEHRFDAVIHLAAESHVDRSINEPMAFVHTNVMGTVCLLSASLKLYEQNRDFIFYHVSTDEVFGSLGSEGYFTESMPYDPQSPYSASKAASDHFVRAFGNTYGLPFVISNCSNNYGPNHFPEKLIPLTILNIIKKKPLPIYGDGNYTRDWLFVEDHARAIDLIFHRGTQGETYNVGGFNEYKNIDLVHLLCKLLDDKLNRPKGSAERLITFVLDRPGHDRRYAIDATKLHKNLGWIPSVSFEEGLERTVDWYLENQTWLQNVIDGSYRDYKSQKSNY